MTPRKTKQGASASTSRTSNRSPRTVASPRTKPATRKAAPKRKAKRRSWRDRPWAGPAIALAVLVAFVWTFYPVASVQYRETREAARLSAELHALRERNDRLRTQVDRLKTPAGVEDYARSQLGLVKKGENVVVVVDDESSSEASQAVAPPTIDTGEVVDQPAGPWTALLDLVFGVR